ncbi:Os03g0705566 [Oryza sativa Japonica Group]|uniref:Os03g0705566 protein n=1 Tax=Oryza sativa subsp. japonica TaxID=39947 RepID=C7IZE7_ORYSJ|nr:Os03g0705566 [Oryza sativa Japonica Group]|eukprot:NP_001173606.1 Os03g0705566 [Oryza sativa Japonica Group]
MDKPKNCTNVSQLRKTLLGAKSKCGMKREEARLPPWKRVGEHTVEGTGAGGTLSATATTMWGQEQPEEKKPASVT